MMKLAASTTQPFTSNEYIGGGAPTSLTTHSGACSDETAMVAPSARRVRSLSLEVTSADLPPRRSSRWNIVSARTYSPDSMYISLPVSRTNL